MKFRIIFFTTILLAIFLTDVIYGQSNTNNKEKKDYPVEIILEEGTYSYSASGVKRYQFRRKYRILNQHGVNNWNYVSASWYPWFQKSPSIKAKVISPDGKIHKLDPATIGETAPQQDSSLVYSDRKTLKGPLPAIEVGSIVEEEYIYQDKIPFFKAGSQQNYRINSRLPIEKSILKINMPENMYFRFKISNSDTRPVILKKEGRKYFTFVEKNIKAGEPRPPYLHPREQHWSTIEFTTTPSWNSIVSEYHKIIKRQMKDTKGIEPILNQVKGGSNLQKIKNIVRIIHEKVRYTGVEFGEAAIVPRSPAEVLKRRYGDCKDKSLLLVMLLRRLGINAHLVLLRAGYGTDVSEDLPGIEFFNHAIVYLPHPLNLWIDPTAEFTPVGELPLADQDRLALIISPATAKLTRTPGKQSNTNTITFSREIFLNQLGNARVKEKYTATGAFASSGRAYYFEQGKDKLQTMFKKYVKKNFNTETFRDIKYTDPKDLTRTFGYSLTIPDTVYGYTGIDDAGTELNMAYHLLKLPESILTMKHFDGKKEKKDSPWKDRNRNIHLTLPHVYKVNYTVHIPPGFMVTRIPDNKQYNIGSSVIKTTYRKKQNTITIQSVFDSGKGQYTPQQLNKLRSILFKINQEYMLNLKLISKATRYHEGGEIKKSIKLFQTLIKRYPSEQSNFIRLGNVLLKAGFRNSAVNYYKKAIAMKKDSIEAHMAMAWAYLHDPFGRQMKGQLELDKAKEIYKKVTKLDPKVVMAWRNLAILNEYNKSGNRYGPGAQFEKSLKYYEHYRNKLKRKDLDYNYLLILFHTGRYDSILDKREIVEKTDAGWPIYLMALAARKGAASMWSELDKITHNQNQRQKILEGTANYLSHSRHYKLASQVFKKLSGFSSRSIELRSKANYFNKLRKWEKISIPTNAPESIVYRHIKSNYRDTATIKDINEIYAIPALKLKKSELRLKEHIDKKSDFMESVISESKSLENVFDVLYSNISFYKDGDDTTGYRIKTSFDFWDRKIHNYYYVVKERGKYKILDTADEFPLALAMLSLQHIRKKRYKEASKVLNWILDFKEASNDRTYSKHPFFDVWTRGSSINNADRMKLATLMLIGTLPEYRKKLEQLRDKIKDKEILHKVDLIRISHYMIDKKYDRAQKIMEATIKKEGYTNENTQSYYYILSQRNNLKKCQELAEKMLKKDPDNTEYIYLNADIKIRQGKLNEAKNILLKAHNKNTGNSNTYNLLAWMGLFTGDSLNKLLNYSIISNRLSNFNLHAHLHTMATIYADMEKITESKQVIFRMLKDRGNSGIEESDHYILGRNAETLGLPDVARYHYRKIKSVKNEYKKLAVYALATRRLQILEKARKNR